MITVSQFEEFITSPETRKVYRYAVIVPPIGDVGQIQDDGPVFADHAAGHPPTGAEQPDRSVAEELLLGFAEILPDWLEKPVEAGQYGFHQGLRSHHGAPPVR